jgi:hypothetical protein
VVKIACESCKTKFEGQFEIPALFKMSQEDLKFVVEFIKSSGSLKEMAQQYQISYPTMRNRLNELIERLQTLEQDQTSKQESILQMLESGAISAKEAAKRLQEI